MYGGCGGGGRSGAGGRWGSHQGLSGGSADRVLLWVKAWPEGVLAAVNM